MFGLMLGSSIIFKKSICHCQYAPGFSAKKVFVQITVGSTSPAYVYLYFQKPSLPLNVGIPLAALIPAPVTIETLLHPTRYLAAYSGLIFYGV